MSESRKISIKNKSLMEFITQLAAGKFLIPTFQRLFVWNPEDICILWDSIYRCYPVGTILCWKTEALLHVHRQLGGFLVPEDQSSSGQRSRVYILDGQQRATALLASFYGGTGKIREHSGFDYTLYFDLVRGDFFFEKDYYRHRWDAEAAFLVRLKDAPALSSDYRIRLSALRGYSPAVERNLKQLKGLFADYRIPLIHLEGFDISGVCAIYERINQTGMRLKNMDILIARGFENSPVVVEEDFPTA